jgi:outer membrane lipoprotein SlyB
MKWQQQFLRAAALAGALSCAAVAQDYRYQGADDAARQTTPQPVQVQPAPVQQQVPPAAVAPVPPPCATCGTVDSIRITERAGEGSAVGMIAGGLLGGLLGHQIGQGRGNTAATIVGAAGGAYAGHQVEKNAKRTLHYDVTVRMDDGTLRTIGYDVEPGFRAGDKVRFIDGRLTRI